MYGPVGSRASSFVLTSLVLHTSRPAERTILSSPPPHRSTLRTTRCIPSSPPPPPTSSAASVSVRPSRRVALSPFRSTYRHLFLFLYPSCRFYLRLAGTGVCALHVCVCVCTMRASFSQRRLSADVRARVRKLARSRSVGRYPQLELEYIRTARSNPLRSVINRFVRISIR